MSAKVQPLAEYVVVVAEEAPNKTASGLYLPGGAAEKPKIAKVVAAGKAVQDVKVGDRVLYTYETTTVKVDGEAYIIIDQKNLIATVN
mgnify:CR=1 FL=1